jgi:hypothetical protein
MGNNGRETGPRIDHPRKRVQNELRELSKDLAYRAHVRAATKTLDNTYKYRFRAGDAFAGRAYCQIQALDVQACPVAVMPAFGCARQSDLWIPACRGSGQLPPSLDTCAKTQGNVTLFAVEVEPVCTRCCRGCVTSVHAQELASCLLLSK